jgi:hypothetical protein
MLKVWKDLKIGKKLKIIATQKKVKVTTTM